MTELSSKKLEELLEQVDGIHLAGRRGSYITCTRKVYLARIEHAQGTAVGRGADIDEALEDALKKVPHGS